MHSCNSEPWLTPLPPSGVYSDKLESGLEYHLIPSGGVFEVRLGVRVGSAAEEPQEKGIAHFFEHMGFRGMVGQSVDSIFEAAAVNKAYINAYTWLYQTLYIINLDPKELETALPWALGVARGWADGITLDSDDFETEKLVVLEELRMYESTSQGLAQKEESLFWLDGYTGLEKLLIGTQESLKSLTVQQMRAFYQKWYRPENMVLWIKGSYDEEKVKTQIELAFKGAFESLPIAKKTQHPNPGDRSRSPIREKAVVIPHLEQSYLQLYLPLTLSLKSPMEHQIGWGKLEFLAYLMEEGLFPALLSKESPLKGLTVSILDLYRREPHLVITTPYATDLDDEALKTLIAQIYHWLESPWDPEQYTILRKQYIDRAYKLESAGLKREDSWPLWGWTWPENDSKVALDTLSPLTSQEFQSWAKSQVIFDQMRVLWLRSGDSNTRGDWNLDLWIKQGLEKGKSIFLAQTDLEFSPWKGAAKAQVVNQESWGPWNQTLFQLSNGHRVFFVPVPRDHVPLVKALSREPLAPAHRPKQPWLTAPTYWLRQGVTDAPDKAFEWILQKQGLHVNIGLDEFFTSIEVSHQESGPQYLESSIRTLLALIYEGTGHDVLTDDFQSELKVKRNQDEHSFQNLLRTSWAELGGNGPSPAEEDKDWAHGDYERLRNLAISNQAWDFYVYAPSSTLRSFAPIMETFFQTLPQAAPLWNWAQESIIPQEPGIYFKRLPLLDLNAGLVVMSFYGKTTKTSFLRSKLEALAKILEIHLFEGLRNQMGATYQLSISFEIRPQSESEYQFAVSFLCDPAKTLEHEATVRKSIAEAVQGKWHPAAREWVKHQLPELHRTELLSYQFSSGELLRHHPAEALTISLLPNLVKQMGLKDITAAARELLNPKALVVLYGP